MQTIIYNAKIYVNKGQFAQALLIEDDIIRQVGTTQQILEAAAADSTKIDAAGRTVIPGLNDSHLHIHGVGTALSSVPLYGSASIAEVIERSREFLKKNPPAPGSVITGRGWNQDYFTDERRLLTRQDLDQITTEVPIIFSRACGHMVVCNTKALEVAGITAATPQIDGGEYYLDEQGAPNGLFSENAIDLISRIIPAVDVDAMVNNLKTAFAYAASHGVTSIHTNDISQENYHDMIEAYKRLYQSNEATLRSYHQCHFNEPEAYQSFLAEGYKSGTGDKYNRIGSLKMFVDGSLGARTALMRQSYADDSSTTGICCMTQEQLNRMVGLADQNDCQVAIHAIGDKAIEMVLDAYDTVTAQGNNPRRHGIIHCQITDLPLLERFRKNDILAYVQPIFIHYDMHIVGSRVGEALASTSYAFGTMHRMGIHTSFGTDSPVEDLNSMDNIYCAVARKDLKSRPAEAYYPNEAVEVADAIDLYTLAGAYASSEEHVKGRLMPGYYADLAILSDDIFTVDHEMIRSIKVDTTMMGGKIVYQR